MSIDKNKYEWSGVAIDYSAGVDFMPDGTIKGRKIGCYVMTHEECIRLLKEIYPEE